MYSVLLSKIEYGFPLIKQRLKNIIKNDYKVAIIPWAFPIEIDGEQLVNIYFKKGEKRYNKYVNSLLEIGILEENIVICNCYKDSHEKLKNIIENVDIILIPGGNPEMLFKKILHDTEIIYDLKKFKGIVIGESAGAELQLTRYFITAKNNYYKYFAFYDGIGILDDPFYIDVHSINNKYYLNKLQSVANDTKKRVLAIFDDGAVIYNRENKKLEKYGNVVTFEPNNI